MLDMVLQFLREQGIIVVLGLLAAGGIFGQVMASLRFRKLRKGIQSLAALQTPVKQEAAAMARKARRERSGQACAGEETFGETPLSNRETEKRNTEASDPVPAVQTTPVNAESANGGTAQKSSRNVSCSDSGQVDSQLLYLKQSLDRIAAGRDQKLEEETRSHRKLTPAEEQIIVDILKEYLS